MGSDSKQISLSFQDQETQGEALAIVRRNGGVIGICLSMRDAGDLEVFMTENDARAFFAMLKEVLDADDTSAP
jgi:hypothetical protein